jgi:hypothetical protein
VMLFWLPSTGVPEFVVNVGAGVCSLAIFINWLEFTFCDSTGIFGLGLMVSRQPDMTRCQAGVTQRGQVG